MYRPFEELQQKYVLKNLNFLERLKYVTEIFSRSLSILQVSAMPYLIVIQFRELPEL